MSRPVWLGVCCYGIFISVAAVFLTVLDKRRARRGGWRIPERTLLLVGFLGGALPMLFTMCFIRHKTRHKKFMAGLPLEILLQLALLGFFLPR